MPEPDSAQTSALRDNFDQVQKVDWRAAATDSKFGALNFAEIIPQLMGISSLCRRMTHADLAAAPPNMLGEVQSNIEQIVQFGGLMRSFDIRQPEPHQRRQTLMNQIRGAYEQFLRVSAPILALTSPGSDEIDRLQSSIESLARAAVVDELERSQNAVADLQAASREAKETVEAIRNAAAQGGVSTHARIFAEQAADHSKQSWWWALATGLVALATIAAVAVAVIYFRTDAGAGPAVIVQDSIAKFIVFSILSYAIVWCARNYSANRHNFVLNKHRENSLATFETFVKAAGGDAEIKNAILLQATTAIFAPQSTGYSSKEPEVDQPNKIIELVRSVKGTAGTA